jgi:hypothetical protein
LSVKATSARVSTGSFLPIGHAGDAETALEQLGLRAETLAAQVDVDLRGRDVAVPGAGHSASGAVPAAAAFVIDECRASWKGRIGLSIFAFVSASFRSPASFSELS